MPAAIRADGLTKYYGPIVGVEDLSFEVERGEIYGFLGPNGAGKTTTIRLLLDLLRPTRGRASVLGLDCHRKSLQARREVGYLPGELPVYRDLTAAGFVEYLSRLDDRPVPPAYFAALRRRFDVSDLDLRRRLRDQSHGMKRKIGIIQALMTRAPVVILDEPTAGLDPLMVEAFNETLADLRKEGATTVFLSSHVLTEVESTCNRVGLIRGGRMVTVGTIDELRRTSPRRVVIDFAAPVDSPPPDIPGATTVSATARQWILDVRGPLGPLMTALHPLPVYDIQAEAFRLEDYVMQFYQPAGR
jgi:ABC-2 type transport system ATP-binding protein